MKQSNYMHFSVITRQENRILVRLRVLRHGSVCVCVCARVCEGARSLSALISK